jgi:HlyD family secretion protein
MRRGLSLLFLLLLAAAGAGIYHFWPRLFPPPAPRFFQGYVDGDLLQVGPEIGGRIRLLAVREGDRVTLGQTLLELDDRVQQAEVELAAAQLEEARARLRLAEAQRRRPEEIRILEAAVEQARAALEVSRAEYERARRLYEQRVVPKARLDAARGALDRDRARYEEARRQLETARLPARAEEINAAWAAVRAAEARLRAARVNLQKTRVLAPAAGRVQEVYFYPGEIVGAGQAVLSLLPPGNLKVRFYVPEPLRARFQVGDSVRITCDSCPPDLFARITFISARAEYTPPVIFSPRERAKLVYRFEARPVRGAWRLAIGQPVDVWPAGKDAAANAAPPKAEARP